MNTFTEMDKVCVNCKHYAPNNTVMGWLDRIIDDGRMYHRCSVKTELTWVDKITGKVVTNSYIPSCHVTMETKNCNWEPSKKFAEKKENTFKMITHENK